MLVGCAVPDIDDVVLAGRQNDWNLGVENNRGNVFSVTALVEGVEAHAGLVVPHFDDSVIVTGHEVWLLRVVAKIDAVNAGFVAGEGIVCSGFLGADGPNLNALV